MDTVRYRAFINAADTGSIKAAADMMGYTPSGVSQLIQALENELHVTLLRRSKKGVTLTSAGELIAAEARILLQQEHKLMQVASDINGAVCGNVNVAAYHSLASAWMPEIIAKFQQEYSQVRINLYEGTQQDIVDHLMTGRSDVAFFNDSMMTGKYDWIPIRDDPMLAVVPKSHPLAGTEKFPVEKFSGERFIMPEHGFDYDVMEILGKSGVVPDVFLSTFDSYILLEMVNKGLGVSIVNEACLRESDRNENIAAIPLDPSEALKMGIVIPSLKDAAPAVKKFVEFAVKVMEVREDLMRHEDHSA